MPLPILRMEQTYLQLGLNTIRPVQDLQQPQAQINMQAIPTRMEIRMTRPELRIDSTEARADLGFISTARGTAQYATKGRQAALEAIAKKAQEGLALRSIEHGRGGIQLKQISKQNFNKPMLDSQVTFLPKFGSLSIDWIPGSLEIQFHTGGVDINTIVQPPIHNYTPGRVEGYVLQQNSIRMWVDPQVDSRL